MIVRDGVVVIATSLLPTTIHRDSLFPVSYYSWTEVYQAVCRRFRSRYARHRASLSWQKLNFHIATSGIRFGCSNVTLISSDVVAFPIILVAIARRRYVSSSAWTWIDKMAVIEIPDRQMPPSRSGLVLHLVMILTDGRQSVAQTHTHPWNVVLLPHPWNECFELEQQTHEEEHD